ncbi:hypothetical protein LZ31DRAFT_258412 [Colletotrichum somersetense]|nr:hypothetical protein LZ31DRAFT_258412 [Colletotrichum somersetense]
MFLYSLNFMFFYSLKLSNLASIMRFFLMLFTLTSTVAGQQCSKSRGGCLGHCQVLTDDATVCVFEQFVPDIQFINYPCGVSDGTLAGPLSKGNKTVCIEKNADCRAFDDAETQCPDFLN